MGVWMLIPRPLTTLTVRDRTRVSGQIAHGSHLSQSAKHDRPATVAKGRFAEASFVGLSLRHLRSKGRRDMSNESASTSRHSPPVTVHMACGNNEEAGSAGQVMHKGGW